MSKKINSRIKKNKNKNSKKGGSVPPNKQWSGPNVAAPPPQYNAGLFTGPQFNGPWGAIPVTPTTTNMINNNLGSATPPPGAMTQYPGTNRLGNNWIAMPGVDDYISSSQVNWGPYALKCTNPGLGACTGFNTSGIFQKHLGGSNKKKNNKKTNKKNIPKKNIKSSYKSKNKNNMLRRIS